MSGSRYLSIIAATLVAVALFWGLAVPQLLPSRDANWIGGMYAAKEAKAAQAKPPRLILLSGSSGLFGLSAELLERRLAMPVVNFSTHAGLGVKYLLNRAERVLHPGDIVYMALEYELLAPQTTPGRILTNFVSAKDLPYLASAPVAWLPNFLTGHGHKSLVWALIERLGLWRYKQSCYGSAKTLNRNGDETCAEASTFAPGNQAALQAQGAIALATISPPAFDPSIQAFIDWGRAHQVKIVIGFPPLFAKPAYAGAAYDEAFAGLARRLSALGLTVLGAPKDFLYPLDHMHDTRYHLHSQGREAHTLRILRLLCLNVLTCRL